MLHAVMYHYVRERTRNRFPRLRSLDLSDFRDQVAALGQRYEMASLESALAYLRGDYHPRRDLCLLTFDDGLKEHHAEVSPLLAERDVQGVFFLTTACLQEGRVLGVHKNHFLWAELGFSGYRQAFLDRLARLGQAPSEPPDPGKVSTTYRWDPPEEGAFKYMFNFQLAPAIRREVVDGLFQTYLGQESAFAGELYLGWEEAREMQEGGMILGGHTHGHRPLATLSAEEQAADLTKCRQALSAELRAQTIWPFSYPYGKQDSFHEETVRLLQELAFDCAFTSDNGGNGPGQDLFRLRRTDAKAAGPLLD